MFWLCVLVRLFGEWRECKGGHARYDTAKVRTIPSLCGQFECTDRCMLDANDVKIIGKTANTVTRSRRDSTLSNDRSIYHVHVGL